MTFKAGKLAGKDVVIVRSGIGKVNACLLYTSTAFVPSVVGLIIASEVIKDITHDAMVKTRHENGVDIEG